MVIKLSISALVFIVTLNETFFPGNLSLQEQPHKTVHPLKVNQADIVCSVTE